MTGRVDYEDLFPDEFQERQAAHPVGYLPLGTLEWHGPQNALGADMLQARALFRLAAARYGGIVFPPLWVGPDRITAGGNGGVLIGMDTAEETEPHRQLPGSCYWIPQGLFTNLVESILAQAKRTGFKCLIADGHGPSRQAWFEMCGTWERQFGLVLLSALRDFGPGEWRTQMDHAGKNETSAMLALDQGAADLGRLPPDRRLRPTGVMGEDPRDSSADYGRSLLDATADAIGAKLARLGFA